MILLKLNGSRKNFKKGNCMVGGFMGRWKLRKDWGIPIIRIHDIAKE